MLAVYDCMLFFRAASRPGHVHSLFELVDQGRVVIALSVEVLAEVRDVLKRPKLIAKYPALTSQAVDAFLAQYVSLAQWVDNVAEHYVLVRDPKDSKYLNLAIEINAPYVVTTDLDLLDLMDPQNAVGVDFRHGFPAVEILTPAGFETVIRKAVP